MPKNYRNASLEVRRIVLEGAHRDPPILDVPLMLNRQTLEYSAEVYGSTISSKDPADVERRALELARSVNTVTWTAAIEVTWGRSSNYGGGGSKLAAYHTSKGGNIDLTGSYSRFWWALFPDGKTRRVDYWECPPESMLKNAHTWTPRIGGAPFDPPIREIALFGEGNTWWLPFDEDTWNGLGALVEKIAELDQLLAALVHTTEGRARLAAAALPLTLPPPTPDA